MTNPTRYTALLYIRGERDPAVVTVVVPVEPFGKGRWRHRTDDGWRIVSEEQTWETQEAAVEAAFARTDESSQGSATGEKPAKLRADMEKPPRDYEPLPCENVRRLTLAEAKAIRPGFVWPKGPMATAAERRPANYAELPEEERWAIDKELGILDWDGSPET